MTPELKENLQYTIQHEIDCALVHVSREAIRRALYWSEYTTRQMLHGEISMEDGYLYLLEYIIDIAAVSEEKLIKADTLMIDYFVGDFYNYQIASYLTELENYTSLNKLFEAWVNMRM